MKHIKTYQLFEYIADEAKLKRMSKLPNIWYHGTNKNFDKFSKDNMGDNWEQSILGIYFSQHMNPPPFGSTAGEYARDAKMNKGGDAIVYEVRLNFKNPLIIDSDGWYSSNLAIDKQRSDIKRWLNSNKEYDAIIAYNSGETDIEDQDFIVVVQDPNIIEIIKKHKV